MLIKTKNLIFCSEHCNDNGAVNEMAATIKDMSLVVRKPVFGVFHQVPHKPGCTATDDGWRLEISYLGSRGIVLSV